MLVRIAIASLSKPTLLIDYQKANPPALPTWGYPYPKIRRFPPSGQGIELTASDKIAIPSPNPGPGSRLKAAILLPISYIKLCICI